MADSLTDRFARWGPSGTRAVLLAAAGVVVLLVACVLVVMGVDSVETVATLLVAVVFGAGLLAGRTAGLVAAALATGAYVLLRQPDMDATGAANFGVLVITRAMAYGIVALAGDRARRLVESLGGEGERGAPLPIERSLTAGQPLAPLPVAAGAGGFGSPASEWGSGTGADQWGDVPHPSDWRVGPSALPPDDPEASPWTGSTGSVADDTGEWQPEAYPGPQPYPEPRTDAEAEPYPPPQPYAESETYADPQPYAEAETYGEPEPYGEAESYPAPQPYAESETYGEPQPYGEPETYGEPQPYGEAESYPTPQPYAEPEPFTGPSLSDERIDTGALELWMQQADAPEPTWAAPPAAAAPVEPPALPEPAGPPEGAEASPWPPADDPWGPPDAGPEPEPAAAPAWDDWAPSTPAPEPPAAPAPTGSDAWDTGQRPQVEASYVDTGQAPVVRGWSDPALEPEPEPAAAEAWGAEPGGPWADAAPPSWGASDPYRSTLPAVVPGPGGPAQSPMPAVDPETRLWSARYLCDRLATEQRQNVEQGQPFSLVLVQVPDGPLSALSYRRQITLLRELGHQFVAAGVVDHLVHVPDEVQHWFAVVLPGTDAVTASGFERQLREGIGGYLRSRGLLLGELQSACLTSPDDDEMMGAIWETLIARGDPNAAPALANDR